MGNVSYQVLNPHLSIVDEPSSNLPSIPSLNRGIGTVYHEVIVASAKEARGIDELRILQHDSFVYVTGIGVPCVIFH
jgi:hypothetical protein